MNIKFKLVIVLLLLFMSRGKLHAQNVDSLNAEIKTLKEQVDRIDELERRLAQMESDSSNLKLQQSHESINDSTGIQVLEIPSNQLRDANPVITGNDLVQDDFKGSWPMFGSNFRMKVGGYFKADFLYDFNGTTDKTQFLMASIPVEGTPEYANSGYIYFMSQETRFNIDVRRTSGKVPLRLFIEGDFWTSTVQFRLRHAYIVAGDFLVGQTWTNLSILESLVFLIDFAAGDALFGGRTTQIRYQRQINDSWKVAASLENLDFLGIENPNMLDGKPTLQLPLFSVRADYSWKTGVLIMGSSIAQLHWDGGAGPDARAVQFDIVVGGRQYIGKNNFFTWNVSYGVGSGENIMAFAGSQANAVLDSNGNLQTIPAFAALLGFMHNWNEKFSSNFSYAYGWLETPESRAPFALKQGGIGHANLIYNPIKNLYCGIEFIHGGNQVTNGAKGTANRLQAMVKFTF
jgi:hypothetical protein